jgi:DNA-binding transcriptional MerR regulator
MEHEDNGLSIEELAERTQTPVRTVRYYIAEKMLPGPGARGKGAIYSEDHLLRLRLIRRLAERRTPLAEIREVMARVSGDEIRGLLAEEETLIRARDKRAVSPRAYISALLDQAQASQRPARSPYKSASPLRSHAAQSAPATPAIPTTPATQTSAWRRVELAPGVELHIQEELEEQNRLLIARALALGADETERE